MGWSFQSILGKRLLHLAIEKLFTLHVKNGTKEKGNIFYSVKDHLITHITKKKTGKEMYDDLFKL